MREIYVLGLQEGGGCHLFNNKAFESFSDAQKEKDEKHAGENYVKIFTLTIQNATAKSPITDTVRKNLALDIAKGQNTGTVKTL